MDYLDGLWNLYENDVQKRMATAVDAAKAGQKDLGGGKVAPAGRSGMEIGVRKPQPKPELRPQSELEPVTNKSPNELMQSNPAANATLSPELSKSQQVDDLRKGGMPVGQAFQQVHGNIDNFADQQVTGDIARAFGRTQSDKSSAQSVKIDTDSESLLGKDHQARSQDTAPTKMDGMSGQNSEVSDQDQEENEGTPPEPQEQLSPEQELDSDIDKIKQDLGTQEDTPESIEYQSQQTQPDITPKQQASEDERRQTIVDSLNRMMETPDKKKGAGANNLSREDAELL